jgi:dCMP deaminase
MLVGLCGPACAGKRSVADFLIAELGFTGVATPAHLTGRGREVGTENGGPAPAKVPSAALMSQCWRRDINVVIERIPPGDPALPDLLKRPYFLLVHVSAPLLLRFDRATEAGRWTPDCLREFVREDDLLTHGLCARAPLSAGSDAGLDGDRCASGRRSWTLMEMAECSRLRILNDAPRMESLLETLRDLDVTNQERLRPGWDSYFMSLAELASERTNCMKRRVGCVIAKNRRLVATGYNGTPSKVRNCLDGGCARCNGAASKQGVGLDLCLCLHAEENAIIEAGRERCEGGTLYTNLFPCILCAKKIIQAGIRRVVFSLAYATDDASKALLHAGQVTVEAHSKLPVERELTR